MDRSWFKALMLVYPLHPGPPLEPDTTLDCRGCGRKIPLDGLHMKDKVRCKGCGRIQWITEKHLAFRYTEKTRGRQKAGFRLAATIILGLCLLAVAPMASRSGESLLNPGTLSSLGLPALWIAIFLHVICYGVGLSVGLTLIGLMILVRRHTLEIGIFGAVMTIFGGLGRVVFYLLGEQMGRPFTPSLPYGLALWGLVCTAGSIWRASMFPQR